MKMKKLLGAAVSAVMAVSVMAPAGYARSGKIIVNGSEAEFKNAPVILENRTYVPAEEYLEIIEAEGSVENGEVKAVKNGISASAKTMERNGVDYVALRAFSEELGADIYWEALTGDTQVKLALTEEGVLNKRYYAIQNGGKVLSIVDGGLVFADAGKQDNQCWMLQKKSDGCYSFTNKSNGNSPDVPNGQTDSGVKLIQYSANNNDNQRFALEKKDGVWYIKVKHSKLYFTVDSEGGITQEEFTGKENQQFVFTYVGREESVKRGVNPALKVMEKPSVKKGWYRIEQDGACFAFVGGAVTAEKIGGNLYQQWRFSEKNGGCVLINREGEKAMDDEVVLSWNGDGTYSVMDKPTGLFYAIKDGKLVKEAFSGQKEQKFVLNYIEGYEEAAAKYETTSLNKKCFRIENGGKTLAVVDGAVIFADKAENDAGEWQLLTKGKEYYSVTNKESGKSIDVPNASIDPGVVLIQYAPSSGDNQQFSFIKNSDGTYSVKVKHSGLFLTNTDGKLTQEEYDARDSQKFSLVYTGDSDVLTMGVTAMPFLIEGEEYVTNMKVQWNEVYGAEIYNVYRREGKGKYEFLESLEGLCTDDYDLKIGESYSYRVEAVADGFLIDSAESEAAKTYQLPNIEFNEFSNIKASGLNRPNSLTDGKTYFSLSHKGREDGVGGFGSMVLRTSEDGITYGDEMEVLSFEDIINSPSAKDDNIEYCGFESIHYVYNKETEMLYMWAHMEANGGYGYAHVAVAYGKPGERFKFKCFRPEGDDSRDMGIYVDDDNTAYIICAIHNNADLAIYRLTDDWTDVERRSCIVNYGKWRELPSVLKKDGIYYLFHSGTAGWYPTQGGYNIATNFEGPWSEMRTIGNTNTFSSQSGGVSHLTENSDNALMISYRWMWWWQDAVNRITQNRLMPITMSNGYAFFDYFSRFYYNLEEDLLIPIQKGRILSQGRPITATNLNEWASDANDGNYKTEWVAEKEWPQSVTINLEQVYDLSELQISWRSYNGSETYYNYTVEASLDGVNYKTILDKSEGYTDYAFTVDDLSGSAQYVRINILGNVSRSGNSDAYAPNMYEIRVLGY